MRWLQLPVYTLCRFYDSYKSLCCVQLPVCSYLSSVKPGICKQTSPNFLRFTTLTGLGPRSFTTLSRPLPGSNSSPRQLEHFRFYTSATFIASLALHAQNLLYPLEGDGLLKAARERNTLTVWITTKKKWRAHEGC